MQASANYIQLSPFDLSLAAILVILLVLLSVRLRLGLALQLTIAAVRTAVQLTLVGLVLHLIFAQIHLGWVLLMALVMLLAAGREVMQRQHHRFSGWWGFGVGAMSMFVSSFSVTLFALLLIIGPDPWYTPQYSIPLLGMLLGNTMNGISIGLDRLTQNVWIQRAVIENRLMLGHDWNQAVAGLRRESIRSGLIPIINAMAAAGIVSLPGMMTGQLLHGAVPMDAVKYQILIMFLIASGTGFGVYFAVWSASKHLFDERQRLRLDRLRIRE